MASQSPTSPIADMFKPPPGPKEGRERPGYRPLIPHNRQKPVFFTFVVFVCICLFISRSTPTRPAFVHLPPSHPAQTLQAKAKSATGSKPESAKPAIQQDAPQAKTQQKVLDGAEKPTGPQRQTLNSDATAPKKDLPWRERHNFHQRLQDLISIYPEPERVKHLLSNITSGGQERMKDLGFRTRMYKKYFEEWERLHTAEDENGEVFVRDNVVQYLQGQHAQERARRGGKEAGEALASTMRDYETVKSFMAQLANVLYPWTAPFYADHLTLRAALKKGGRGIVLTAGTRQVHYLLTSIYSFRKLGCNLPIEVMYLGDKDMSEDFRDKLEELPGVITRDLSRMVNDEGWTLRGWAAKPFAILLSSFRETIFIDADSLFFKNPELLFDDPGYKETGALFFRDRIILPESKRDWLKAIFDGAVPKKARESRLWSGRSGHQQESGVVVMDTWRHFIPMLLICRFNGSDRDPKDGLKGVYEMMHGDKESFWIGFLLAGTESFSWHMGDTGAMGRVESNIDQKKYLADEDPAPSNTTDTEPPKSPEQAAPVDVVEPATNYTICSSQLLHLDLDNTPLWLNGWLLDSKFADKNHQKWVAFDSYVVEPRGVREPTPWQLGKSNKCCLTTDHDKKYDFSPRDKSILHMITERAVEVDNIR